VPRASLYDTEQSEMDGFSHLWFGFGIDQFHQFCFSLPSPFIDIYEGHPDRRQVRD
jgi:hypothetical protein